MFRTRSQLVALERQSGGVDLVVALCAGPNAGAFFGKTSQVSSN